MKNLKHTKGEWKIGAYKPDGTNNASMIEIKKWLCDSVDNTISHGDSIKEFYVIFNEINQDEVVYTSIVGNGPTSEANAKLIATAPEMLECLIEDVKYFKNHLSYSISEVKKLCEVKVKRIEKATGLTIEEVLK